MLPWCPSRKQRAHSTRGRAAASTVGGNPSVKLCEHEMGSPSPALGGRGQGSWGTCALGRLPGWEGGKYLDEGEGRGQLALARFGSSGGEMTNGSRWEPCLPSCRIIHLLRGVICILEGREGLSALCSPAHPFPLLP